MYISGTVTIGRGHKIEYPRSNQEGSRGRIIQRDGSGTRSKSRMATYHVRLQYIQPGSSATTNQRTAFLRPPRLAPGASHSADVSFPARCTRVSMRMSLIRFPREIVFVVSHNAPHGAEHSKQKGRGPVSISAVLTAISLRHRWLYISVNTVQHSTCQSGVWKRLVGKSVRTSEYRWQIDGVHVSQHNENTLDAQSSEIDIPGSTSPSQRMVIRYGPLGQWGHLNYIEC